MITPFTDDNHIDFAAVEALLEWYAKRNVTGVFAICQSSEIFFLSVKEKCELLRFVKQNAPKGMQIVASGHTADNLDQQIREAAAYIDIGMDAYVLIPNRLAKQDEDDSVFLKNLETFVRAFPGVPMGFYECPYPYKRILTPDVIRTFAGSDQFYFLKDTCCDVAMMKAKMEAMQGTQLKLFNANAATLLETLRLGCAGYSGVMANFHPELYAWLCQNFDKDPALAKEVQDFIGFFSVAECQEYPINAKYYLSLEGLQIGCHTRVKDPARFTRNRRLEIDQMHALTRLFKDSVFDKRLQSPADAGGLH